jgi:HPt (histidine-containing phosphotransfer) domain-containing protein
VDACLAKPVRPGDLAAVLRRVLGEGAPRGAPGLPAGSAPGLPDPPPIDVPAARAAVGGDLALLEELTGELLDTAPALLRDLRTAAARGDGDALKLLAHRARGALLAVSAGQAAALARDVEVLAEEVAGPRIGPVLDALEVELARIRAFVARPEWREGT